MKRCDQCGKVYDDGTKFCLDCGAKLVDAPEASAAPEPGESAPPPILDGNLPFQLTLDPPAAQEQPLPEPSHTPGSPDPTEPPVPTEPDKPRKERRGNRLGFGRGLAFVLISVLLFLLLAAPLAIYTVRRSTSEEGVAALLEDIRPSTLPASELIPTAPAGKTLADWVGDELCAALGERYDFTRSEVAEFLDRSSLKASTGAAVAAVLEDCYAGRGDHELSWYEYSVILQENAGFFSDVFGRDLSASEAGMLAKYLVANGLWTLGSQETQRESAPVLYYSLHLGCSWVALGVLLALAVVVLIWLCCVGKSALRGFKALGVDLVILGGLTVVASVFAKLFPRVLAALPGLGTLTAALIGGVLFRVLLVDLGILVAGILILLIVHLIRKLRDRHADRREERERRRHETKVPEILDD